mgnify:CR=1 FL=1
MNMSLQRSFSISDLSDLFHSIASHDLELRTTFLRFAVDFTHELDLDPERARGRGNSIQYAAALASAVVSLDPNLRDDNEFDVLPQVEDDFEYGKALTVLFPDLMRELYKDPIHAEGIFDLDRVDLGLYDPEEIRETLAESLRAANEGSLECEIRLRNLAQTANTIIEQQVAALASPSNKSPSIEEIERGSWAFRAVHALLPIHEASDGQRELSAMQRQLAWALLNVSDEPAARVRYHVYKELIGAEQVPLEIQQLAFENLAQSKVVSDNLLTHHIEKIKNATPDQQRRFYKWIGIFLRTNDSIVSDRILPFLLNRPELEERFLNLRRTVTTKGVVPCDAFLVGRPSREQAAAQSEYWQPSISDDLEILFAFDHLAAKTFRVTRFDIFIENLLDIYTRGNYSPDLPDRYNYTYTVDDVERVLRRYIPDFSLSFCQREAVVALFADQGSSYRDQESLSVFDAEQDFLEEEHVRYLVDQILSEEQIDSEARKSLIYEFTTRKHGIADVYYAFGPQTLTPTQKTQLAKRREQLRAQYHELCHGFQ